MKSIEEHEVNKLKNEDGYSCFHAFVEYDMVGIWKAQYGGKNHALKHIKNDAIYISALRYSGTA